MEYAHCRQSSMMGRPRALSAGVTEDLEYVEWHTI